MIKNFKNNPDVWENEEENLVTCPATDEDCNVQGTLDALKIFKQKYGRYPTVRDLRYNSVLRREIKELTLDCINDLKERVHYAMHTPGRVPVLKTLPHEAIVEILVHTDDFRNVKIDNSGNVDMLYMRISKGSDSGTFKYQSGTGSAKEYGCQKELLLILSLLKADIKGSDRREIVGKLLARVPEQKPNSDPFLIPCANGVFDYHRKQAGKNPFVPYDDPTFRKIYKDVVFIRKLATAYNELAVDQLLTRDGFSWSIDRQDGSSGQDAIFGTDDLGKVEKQLFYLIVQFAVRGISGGRAWFFVDGTEYGDGANGKDTLLQMTINLIGPRHVITTPITDLADDRNSTTKYKLGDLPETFAIIASEADNAKTLVKCALLKNLMRGQPVDCRKIFAPACQYSYKGIIIQALNDPALKTTDTTESMWRKAEFLTFRNTFKNSGKSFINEDYIQRPSVLEALLKMVLDLPFEMEYPKDLLDVIQCNKKDAKEASNPIFTFCDLVFSSWLGDLIPLPLLWDLYQAYEADNNLHYMNDQKQFYKSVRQWIGLHSDEWEPAKNAVSFPDPPCEPIVYELFTTTAALRRGFADIWLSQDPLSVAVYRYGFTAKYDANGSLNKVKFKGKTYRCYQRVRTFSPVSVQQDNRDKDS